MPPAGIQVGAIDALLARHCIRHSVTMLAADQDFADIARRSMLKVWRVEAPCAGPIDLRFTPDSS